jgi:hypothetical protein
MRGGGSASIFWFAGEIEAGPDCFHKEGSPGPAFYILKPYFSWVFKVKKPKK